MKRIWNNNRKQRTTTYIWEAVAVTASCIMLIMLPGLLSYNKEIRKAKKALEVAERAEADRYCDLVIPDSEIRFPVLKGEDNLTYLHTTYTGETSELGAIFMDYRCDFEESPHKIIYGHDVQDLNGNRLMFGTLRKYLDENFIKEHPVIRIVKGGNIKEYILFAVKITDVNDEAYDLDFGDGEFEEFVKAIGAPDHSSEILTLSTCLGKEEDLRLLVQGAIIDDTQ